MSLLKDALLLLKAGKPVFLVDRASKQALQSRSVSGRGEFIPTNDKPAPVAEKGVDDIPF